MDDRIKKRLVELNMKSLGVWQPATFTSAPEPLVIEPEAAAPPPASMPLSPCRPGAELKAILKDWLGIEADAGCGCNDMAARMDSLGPDWCESDAGMAAILDTMRAEHAKRWSEGRTRLPWTDLGARQLVHLACRRARQKQASQG